MEPTGPTTARPGSVTPSPDLQTQLEEILHTVWVAEADWRLSDRIDLATRTGTPRYFA